MKNILFIIILFFSLNSFSQKKQPAEKPRLIVTIFVEGMRYDYLYNYWDKFTDDGFKRLVNNGKYYQNAEYDYLYTKSSSGYATVVTGSNPSQHGIVNDYWYKRITNTKKYCIYDKKQSVLGTTDFDANFSPKSLLTSTFSDELRLSNYKQSKVISISPKDYAAVLSGGHLANAAYWTDNKTGKWVSGTYYFSQLPRWVNRFNEKKFPDLSVKRMEYLFTD